MINAIVGVSGLANAMPFKRMQWPKLDDREYRISQGHDAAAAIVVDGKIVAAAAEERFNRQKQSGEFPVQALGFCLREAGLKMTDVSEIAHCFDYRPWQDLYLLDPVSYQLYRDVFSRETLIEQVRRYCPGFEECRIHQVGHHLSHAASAYLTSGWDDCLVGVLDAMGETQSVSIYTGVQGELKKVREISANDSIGILYSLVTLHLGFDFNSDEYKIMGLAPYGDPARYEGLFQQAVDCRPDGTLRIPILRLNRTRDERENYLKTRQWLSENLLPPRHPDDPITERHRDAAAALQTCLERVVLHICGHFGNSTGLKRLALAGGVALNCAANGVLVKNGPFDEVYVQPAAGDDGAALGAALYRASVAGNVENERMPVPFLGPAYSNPQIDQAIEDFNGKVRVKRFSDFDQLCKEAANLIAQGKVIAWYRGKMEFGPRALGNRSILANPGHPEMRDRINAMVKKREAFRPFAPAVSMEQVDLWFEVAPMTAMPYMITTVPVRREHRLALPAITHVNGSARVQTVSAADNSDFHALLSAVGRTTGREMVLNTSFNVKGQPIVNSPSEALETFLGTSIDYLFLQNVLVSRRQTGNQPAVM